MDRKLPVDEGARAIFQLNPYNEQGYETEGVWAERVGPNEFRILNSPFLFPVLQAC
jgi:hypothetical protein